MLFRRGDVLNAVAAKRRFVATPFLITEPTWDPGFNGNEDRIRQVPRTGREELFHDAQGCRQDKRIVAGPRLNTLAQLIAQPSRFVVSITPRACDLIRKSLIAHWTSPQNQTPHRLLGEPGRGFFFGCHAPS